MTQDVVVDPEQYTQHDVAARGGADFFSTLLVLRAPFGLTVDPSEVVAGPEEGLIRL
jgi:hypothetical protein